MATMAEWIEGARLRTLAASISPVLAGTAIAVFEQAFSPLRALLCLGVSLAVQIGANYANDYSDGIRGSDAERVGPQRLVGSGAATPGQVKAAAFVCFGVAGVLGLVLVALTGRWWLLAVGAACFLAAWYYTGGKHPYGYYGLGEVFVFIFFGLVATLGTGYVQLLGLTVATWWAAIAMGALACGVLVTNNLRDLASDAAAGKHTLETRLGDRASRWFYLALLVVALVGVIAVAAGTTWWALLGLVMLVFLGPAGRRVLAGQTGMGLVQTLKYTGFGELAAGLGLLVGCFIGA